MSYSYQVFYNCSKIGPSRLPMYHKDNAEPEEMSSAHTHALIVFMLLIAVLSVAIIVALPSNAIFSFSLMSYVILVPYLIVTESRTLVLG